MMFLPYAEDPCGAEQGYSPCREVMAEFANGRPARPSRLT